MTGSGGVSHSRRGAGEKVEGVVSNQERRGSRWGPKSEQGQWAPALVSLSGVASPFPRAGQGSAPLSQKKSGLPALSVQLSARS